MAKLEIEGTSDNYISIKTTQMSWVLPDRYTAETLYII